MLLSDRITLTKLLESDISKEYLETLNDRDHMQYSRNSVFDHTLSSQARYIVNFNQSNDLLFGIKNVEDGMLLGTINCYINFSSMTLNLGFLIFKNQQNKGYTTEALGLLIPYLEAQFPGMCAVIGTNRNNFMMRKVAQKLNFEIESEDPQTDKANLQFVRRFPQFNSQTQPMIPDFIFNAKKVGVAAHDAGGAEQITWILRNISQRVLAYIDGPAQRIFESSGISFDQVVELNEIMECDLIITGSGWMSQLEVNVINEARQREIPCLTILDHWVNYLERFGDDEKNQPQILAVTNSIALKIAQERFPHKVIWLLPDFQIRSYRENLMLVDKARNCVLILLEPPSILKSIFAIDSQAIESLIDSAILVMRDRGLSGVIIRLHPSQMDDPSLLNKLKGLPEEFTVSKGAQLIEDLEVSKVVLGFSSYALYISSQCEIATYSYFADRIGHWTNYFPKILKIDF